VSDNSGIKPLVTTEMVLPLLQDYFDGPVHDLQTVEGGNVAQAFSFKVESSDGGNYKDAAVARDYIVRFNAPTLVNFEKEAYVYENFTSPLIPIPRVVHIGGLGDVPFAITEKASGRNLLQIPRGEYLALIPKLIEVLDAIHQTPVGVRQGYGIFDGSGVAQFPSWRAHLEFVKEDPGGDFFAGWHSLFENSFLERDVFERLYGHMMQLIEHCPEERYLVHGDYGYGNVLAQDGRITAVLDWMGARYGDFLYDVAWLDFWSPVDSWRERFEQHYRRIGQDVPHYRERVLCYQCYIALEALKFYAKIDAKPSYDFAAARIHSLLNER
jgi:hygromycin-B 4-O-kinase